MIVGIIGSRTISNFQVLLEAIEASKFSINKVVSGGAFGVDRLAKRYAELKKLDYQEFKPEYSKYPPYIAPLLRNQTIIDNVEALIAVRIRDGKSNGTDDAIRRAKKKGTPLYIHLVNQYQCPVCDFPELIDVPADYLICPSCGTEFGNDDAFYSHSELRKKWIENGKKWFSHIPQPENWNPTK